MSSPQGNDIRLVHFPSNWRPGTPFSVRLVESEWQRQDKTPADREHLLMALADLEYIIVRTTFNDYAVEAGCVSYFAKSVGSIRV